MHSFYEQLTQLLNTKNEFWFLSIIELLNICMGHGVLFGFDMNDKKGTFFAFIMHA